MLAKPSRGIERIAIVGVGAVGSTTAYAMIQAGVANEILLVDMDRRRAEGELMDLQHCVPFSKNVSLSVIDLPDLTDCDLVVITAGVAQKPGESRLDLVRRNVDIYRTFFPRLAVNNPEALFLIVTNPVDIMTRVALKLSCLPPSRVFGSGTVLDTARFRQLISQHCRIAPRNVHGYVIGEHGDSEVMVWSRAMIGAFHVEEYCRLHGIPFGDDQKREISKDVRRAAYEIIERKGATHFAIGLATVRLAESLSHSQHSLYTVSRQFHGLYGLHEVCLSIPTLISRAGAVEHLELTLAEPEHEKLMESAEVLEEAYRQIGLE
ncbi:L-lactate dehydrogenase [bacterium]|nr:L-lactate dehydrogenase [bacterium]